MLSESFRNVVLLSWSLTATIGNTFDKLFQEVSEGGRVLSCLVVSCLLLLFVLGAGGKKRIVVLCDIFIS